MTYTEDVLTEWFGESPPVRDGVYKVRVYTEQFAYWSFDIGWGGASGTVEGATELKSKGVNKNHFHTIGRWRGLKQNPSAQKKKPSGNKKKTMWIVSAWVNGGETYKHVGAFENHDNAVNAAKRYKQPRINKVRFRTPEA